jgi:hypothetical protein
MTMIETQQQGCRAELTESFRGAYGRTDKDMF